MRRAAIAVLALCMLALAGCLGAPAQNSDGLAIEYQVSNGAATDYDVTLVVAPDPFDGARVTFANGTRRTYDVGRIDQLPPSTLGQATEIEPLGDTVQTRTLAVDTGTGFGGTLENVTEGSVVLYTVQGADGDIAFRGWGGVRCPSSADRLRVEVSINANETFNAGVTCSGT